MYYQGDLVSLAFPVPLPDGGEKPHPVLIVSSNSSNAQGFYTAVMMTSTDFFDDAFSFPCEDFMFQKNLQKSRCQLRLFILVSFSENEINWKVNKMTTKHLEAVLKRIREQIFSR